jgi:hypothetical protein
MVIGAGSLIGKEALGSHHNTGAPAKRCIYLVSRHTAKKKNPEECKIGKKTHMKASTMHSFCFCI